MSWNVHESEIAGDRRRRHGVLASDPPRGNYDDVVLPDPRGILSRRLVNDPALFTLVRVRAIRRFFVAGRLVEIGETVSIPRHLAAELLDVKVTIL